MIDEPMQFMDRLRRLNERSPFSITSYARTPEHNAKVGGAKDSLHLTWLAADCVIDGPHSSQDFLRMAKELGLHGIVEADHIHLQARAPGGAK